MQCSGALTDNVLRFEEMSNRTSFPYKFGGEKKNSQICLSYSAFLSGHHCEKSLSLFAQYNQQDATFHNVFISVRRSTCFRRLFRPSSAAQNCTHSVRCLSDRYCYLLLAAGSSNGLYVQF